MIISMLLRHLRQARWTQNLIFSIKLILLTIWPKNNTLSAFLFPLLAFQLLPFNLLNSTIWKLTHNGHPTSGARARKGFSHASKIQRLQKRG